MSSRTRGLLAAGLDIDSAMEVYRNGTLALRVRSIGEGARLEISDDPPRFKRQREPDAAPPMRSGAEAVISGPDRAAEQPA